LCLPLFEAALEALSRGEAPAALGVTAPWDEESFAALLRNMPSEKLVRELAELAPELAPGAQARGGGIHTPLSRI